MSLVDQIQLAMTRIGQEVKGRLKASNNLQDVANRQSALNYLTGAGSATSEHVLTKDTATGNVVFKASQGSAVTYGTTAGTACEGNDSRLSDARTPSNSSVSYVKVASALKQKNTVTGTVDLSANGIGEITLSANTAFTFTNFELNKTYLLKIVSNGFTPSWAVAAKHVAVDGNAAFSTTGTFYVSLTCIDATSGSEKLLTMIMKVV